MNDKDTLIREAIFENIPYVLFLSFCKLFSEIKDLQQLKFLIKVS